VTSSAKARNESAWTPASTWSWRKASVATALRCSMRSTSATAFAAPLPPMHDTAATFHTLPCMERRKLRIGGHSRQHQTGDTTTTTAKRDGLGPV